MNHFVNNAKRSLRRMMGGSIIDIVCGLQILGVVTYLLSPELFGYLILNPALVVRGQIWRIVTFLAYPPAVTGGDAISFVIFNAIGIYCVRLFGLLVEQVWGRFKFNCYIISGVLLHAAVSVLIYLITGMPLPLFPNYLVYSFFFVFALMFPDMQVLFMMLIPLKSSWIAVFEGVMYIYSFVRQSDRPDRGPVKHRSYGHLFWMAYLWKKRPGLSEKAFQRVPEKDREDPGGEKYPPLCRLRTHLRGQSGDGIPLLLQM